MFMLILNEICFYYFMNMHAITFDIILLREWDGDVDTGHNIL